MKILSVASYAILTLIIGSLGNDLIRLTNRVRELEQRQNADFRALWEVQIDLRKLTHDVVPEIQQLQIQVGELMKTVR